MKPEVFNTFPVLETNRFLLRQMNEKDVGLIYELNTCIETLNYVAREPYKSKEEASAILSYFLSTIKEKTAVWWIFTLKETNEDIGYGGLFDLSQVHNRAEIGYGIRKKYWNKGYMSEILDAILKFGVSTAQIRKIYGVVMSGNAASIKLLEKNNFTKEAHLKEHSFARGKYFDETIYSLITNK